MKKKTTLILISFIFLNTFFSFAQKSEKYLNIQATIIRYNNNDCKGAIEIVALEGNQPFEYSIDAGKTFLSNNVFENLCEGKYFIQVKDADGKLGLTLVDLISKSENHISFEAPILTEKEIEVLLKEREINIDNWEIRREIEYKISKYGYKYPVQIIEKESTNESISFKYKMLTSNRISIENTQMIFNRYKSNSNSNLKIKDIIFDDVKWEATVIFEPETSLEIINEYFVLNLFKGLPNN